MDTRPSEDLLEANHQFPGPYQIKVIGTADDGFVDRVLGAVSEILGPSGRCNHSVRVTPGGRHASMTLDLNVETADQVRSIYARLRDLPGVTMLF